MSVPALDAVNELIRPQSMQLDIGRETHTVKAPCLLAQLQAALEQGTESAAGNAVPGSRPPAALNALDLWLEIEANAHHLAKLLGVDRRDRNEQSPIPHVGRLLRTVTATAHGRGLTAAVDRITDLAHSWKDQIITQFSGQRHQRGLRGYACPTCCATTVLEPREDGIYRVPAVILVTRDYLAEQWMTCLACGFNEPMADHVAAALDAEQWLPDDAWERVTHDADLNPDAPMFLAVDPSASAADPAVVIAQPLPDGRLHMHCL